MSLNRQYGTDETKTPSTAGSTFRLAHRPAPRIHDTHSDFANTTKPAPHDNQRLSRETPRHTLTHTLNTAIMTGVSVRDVPADKFINAYAAFLKRQGKLPIPGP